MSDESILQLAGDVRRKTLKLLEGVDEQQAHFAPPGLNNHILWNAGHSVMLAEHLVLAHLNGRPAAPPAGWFDKFGWKSQPATVKDWPTLAEVAGKLQQQLDEMMALMEPMKLEQFAKVVDPTRGRTLRWCIVHSFHDEATHQGEMWLLKKLWTKRPGTV